MNKRIWIVLLIVAFISGCKKYEDGPLLSLYSKGGRVAGTWYFQSVLYDGKDSTAHYPYQQLNFIYVKKMDGGGFTWNHNIYATSADENPLEGGTWRFISDRDSFEMVVRNLFTRDSVIMKWKINRLAYTEFWMERNVKDTINIQWQLVKYAY
jgi:hypothetical protein